MASQSLLQIAHATLDEAAGGAGAERVTVTAETRHAMFVQARMLMRLTLRAMLGIRMRVWDVSSRAQTHEEIVALLVAYANQRRHVRGLPDIDYDIPSYIGILPVPWDTVVDFQKTGRILDVPHMYVCTRKIARAATRACAAHQHVAFCMVDFERIETQSMCMIGMQIFFAVPMPADMTMEQAGKVSALPIGGATGDIIASYVETLSAAQKTFVKATRRGRPAS